MPPSSVHFNGSVNLPDAETVMREISSRIPNGVRRMTDGETGDRNYWISFQVKKFQQMPEFELVASGKAYRPAPTRRRCPSCASPRARRPRPSSGRTSAMPTRTRSHSPPSTSCSRTARSRPASGCRCSTRRRSRRWPARSCPRTCPRSRPSTRRRCSPTSTPCSSAFPTTGSPCSGTSRSRWARWRARWG